MPRYVMSGRLLLLAGLGRFWAECLASMLDVQIEPNSWVSRRTALPATNPLESSLLPFFYSFLVGVQSVH